MATEGKLEETQMEENIAPLQEQEKEPSKNVNEKDAEIENVKDEEKMDEPKKKDENKINETGVNEECKKENEAEIENAISTNAAERSSSFREESSLLSELKEHEKKALFALRLKIEEAILENKFFNKQKEQEKEISLTNDVAKDSQEKEKPVKEEDVDVKEKSKQVEEAATTMSSVEGDDEKKEGKQEETPAEVEVEEKEIFTKDSKVKEDIIDEQGKEEKTHAVIEEKGEEAKENIKEEGEAKQNVTENGKKEVTDVVIEEKGVDADKDVALWGVPLLPSKGDARTDVILLKFLRAREFKVNDAFEMVRNTLQWRKENNIDSILDEDFGADLFSAAYMEGNDREGHPICYNIFGLLGNAELYDKTLGNEEKREKLLRWRIQLMEKGIKKLHFKPGDVSTMLQINDLKNAPGPTKKELRLATRKAVELLQDNYPEFVAHNIFINVPFWYYAFSTLLSPFLTQRTKSKFVYARAAKVTDTLLRYIAAEEIPVQYGGLKRENDSEFSVKDGAKEAIVKAGSTEVVEIPSPEVGNTLIWDLTVSGWEVNYKEEFVPTDEKSYIIIVQKARKITLQEGPVRNSFKINEPGKIVITIENGSFKKKHILYRYKTKNLSSSSS